MDAFELAGGADELDQPLLEERVDVDLFDGLLELLELLQADGGLECFEWVLVALGLDDLELFRGVRVAECCFEEEAVELRLGEGEDAFVVERVFGCEDQEGAG